MLKNLFGVLPKKGDYVIKLPGQQCILRTFVEADARALAQLLQNNKFYWSIYEPLHRDEYYSEQTQHQKIVEGLRLSQENREFSFGIFDRQTGQLIGHISLYAIKRLPYSSAFVGYSIDQQYAGRGITTEAVALVLDFAFRTLNIHRIEAYVSPENVASVRVLEKSAFVREGLLRELLFINGQWVDHYMYAILQRDYSPK